MEAIFDVVRYFGVREFGQRSFDCDIALKSPGLQRVECDDLDKSSKRPARRFFLIFGVMDNVLSEGLLKAVDRWVGHLIFYPQVRQGSLM